MTKQRRKEIKSSEIRGGRYTPDMYAIASINHLMWFKPNSWWWWSLSFMPRGMTSCYPGTFSSYYPNLTFILAITFSITIAILWCGVVVRKEEMIGRMVRFSHSLFFLFSLYPLYAMSGGVNWSSLYLSPSRPKKKDHSSQENQKEMMFPHLFLERGLFHLSPHHQVTFSLEEVRKRGQGKRKLLPLTTDTHKSEKVS